MHWLLMPDPRQVSGSHPTSPDGTMEDVGPSASASALPEDVDLPNDLPVAEVQKEEDTDRWLMAMLLMALWKKFPGILPRKKDV